ncbi:hypothetical protein BGZ80_009206 [Entomortierella chlamydospora]|uniref:histone acetyltransferase n=1 Tax=Entomortierella chlamydospora TaxID=101097 RepID=A0A9P6N374_9FUNG|nr:hypothetical protein BGZ79_006775 [Entomortierella chlamydospora]KAG0023524.1 hypothetical protein BGZ80_009206 [Entomortierella chlamydospora]
MSRPQFGVRYDSADPILRSIASELDSIYSNRDGPQTGNHVPSTADDNLPATPQQQQQQQEQESRQQTVSSFDFQLESFHTRPKACTDLFPPHVQKQRYQIITVQERLILVSIGPAAADKDTSEEKEGSQKNDKESKDGDVCAVLVAGLEVLEYHLVPINNSPSTGDNSRKPIERIIYIAKVDTSGSWPLPGINSRGLKSPTHALVKGYLNGMKSVDFTESSLYQNMLGTTADRLSSLTISSSKNVDADDNVDTVEGKDSPKDIKLTSRRAKKTSLYIFARAQPQYLFARSAKNSGKHVLDDRGLVRWWKNMVSSVYSTSASPESSSDQGGQRVHNKSKLHGWWHIPGIETERGALRIIQSPHASSTISSPESVFNWTYGYPDKGSKEMANAIIPRFPDDPKSRLMQSPSGSDGYISIGTFWELAAIAEESGAGKITGFFRVTEEKEEEVKEEEESQESHEDPVSRSSSTGETKTKGTAEESSRKHLKGSTRNYTKAINFLLDLNFSTLERSRESTKQWKEEVNKWTLATKVGESESESVESSDRSWIQQLTVSIDLPRAEETKSLHVVEAAPVTAQQSPQTPTVHTLNSGLIKRKEPVSTQSTPSAAVNVLNVNLIKRKAPQSTDDKAAAPSSADTPAVNVLSPGLIKRKIPQTSEVPVVNVLSPSLIKPKAEAVASSPTTTETTPQTTNTSSSTPAVNVLGSDFIKKKRRVDS